MPVFVLVGLRVPVTVNDGVMETVAVRVLVEVGVGDADRVAVGVLEDVCDAVGYTAKRARGDHQHACDKAKSAAVHSLKTSRGMMRY